MKKSLVFTQRLVYILLLTGWLGSGCNPGYKRGLIPPDNNKGLESDEDYDEEEEEGWVQQLKALCACGDFAQVAALLQEKYRPNMNEKPFAVYDSPVMVLYIACLYAPLEVIQLLLNRPDIEVNEGDASGYTPLHWACSCNHPEVVRLLLKQDGIEVNAKANNGDTPLHLACWKGHLEVVKLLLDHPKIEVNATDDYGDTPLHWACLEGDLEVVRLLLAKPNIEVNEKDQRGKTPLLWACSKGYPKAVALLLYRLAWGDRYRDIRDQEVPVLTSGFVSENAEPYVPQGIVDLMGTYYTGSFNSFPRKLEKEPREALQKALNARDKRGHTPLHLAQQLGDVDKRKQIVQLLQTATALCNGTSQQQNDSND